MQSAVSPNTFIYVTFYFLMGRCAYRWVVWWLSCAYFAPVYCNSLLATLNVRQAIRERAHYDLGISLRPIGDTTIGSKNNRRVCPRATCTLLPLTKPLTWDISIKTETVEPTASRKSRGYDGSSVFVQQNTDGLRVVEGEYDLESGRGGHMK